MSVEIQANASQVQLDSCVCPWLEQLHNQFEGVCPSICGMCLSELIIFKIKLRYLHCWNHQTTFQNFP